VSFDLLFTPVDEVDAFLTGLFDGAPILVALGIAALLGLRHASDPDHLVAVTSLVAADDGDPRSAARLGAWWGAGHAGALIVLGTPLIALKAELPAWVENAAERTIGVVILALAARVIVKWMRGDYRASAHKHDSPETGGHEHRRHLRVGTGSGHGHVQVRTRGQAAAIGVVHGLAGTGAVAVLLIAALPTTLEAMLALAVFAPMTLASMVLCTMTFAWVLTRSIVEPVYRTVVIPALGVFGVLFGLWYAGGA
jgi:hypothetical protein